MNKFLKVKIFEYKVKLNFRNNPRKFLEFNEVKVYFFRRRIYYAFYRFSLHLLTCYLMGSHAPKGHGDLLFISATWSAVCLRARLTFKMYCREQSRWGMRTNCRCRNNPLAYVLCSPGRPVGKPYSCSLPIPGPHRLL
jgi:hypothetical protein